MKTVTMQFDEDLLAAVDEARGDIPRQRFVARALEAHLGKPPSVRSAPTRRHAPTCSCAVCKPTKAKGA